MGRLGKYLRPYWGFIILTILIKTAASVMDLFIPFLMERILDDAVPAREMGRIFLYGGLMLLCAAICLGGNILANRMSAISSGKITRKLRHDLFDKLQHLSARQLDELTVSSAESRLTSDTYNVNQLLNRIQRMAIRAPILLVGGAVMMLLMDAPLALVLIGMLPIIVVVVVIVTKKSVPLYTKQQTVLDKVVRVVQENITGIRIIKALSKTDYEKGRFNGVNAELTATDTKAGLITAITNPVASLTLNLGLTIVVVLGAYRVNAGKIESGVIVAFLQYFILMLNAMLFVTRIFIMWSKGQASANRVADVLATPDDITLLPQEEEMPANAPHIEFENVSFSYTGIGKNIDNLSFRLEQGQTLGILGPTGCGKSTIIQLLLRFYDPDEGVIRIHGRDIRTIPNDEFRSTIGTVFQNDFIAEGTIRDNIDFFRAVPEDGITAAANDAQAEFIAHKEGGLDAEVMVRGNNLSGGQKQRLLIARALAASPEILILDDASSALDYQTDANLRRALRQNYRNTTTVVVAQRVSSLRHADLILMLQDGCVIGAGDHDHLMATCQEYRLIAQTQMGEGKEGA